jgi:formamidopyrimidine-DNA glycosylase
MPELPEVELARRHLARWMRGTTITSARVFDARIARGGSIRAIARTLEGRTVEAVDRRGKWLRVTLDDGARLFSHLGMTGKWVSRTTSDAALRSERMRIDLHRGKGVKRGTSRSSGTSETSVRYVDPRLFGRIVVAGGDIAEWSALGPDPLADGVDHGAFGVALAKLRRTVKEALMDQSVLAGVGNILATEALWRARIDPRSRTDALTSVEVRALARGIDASIAASLAAQDGDEITYVEEAGAPNPFRIYGRAGEPCPRCKSPLARIVLGGRGTVFCESCQRKLDARDRKRPRSIS